MPQMMPLMWLLLMYYAIILLIITMSFIFFFFLPSKSNFIVLSMSMGKSFNNKIWTWLW